MKASIERNKYDYFLSGFMLGLFILIVAIPIIGHNDYKKGQIDALTGKVKYQLVMQEDSTRVWKSIREGSH